MFYYDSTYILVIIGALISAIASFKVNSTYKKFSKVANKKGLRAEEVAAMMLRNSGIIDVRIEQIRGNLTDHYSPTEKVLRLSDSVYGSTSVAAVGVAAHECGHALQHYEGYAPLKIRSAAVPVANIGSRFSWLVVLAGLVIGWLDLARIGVFLFMFVVAFQLVTLPVEFDASARALRILKNDNILDGSEVTLAGKVLKAAALTYVAALFSSILQLLRLILIVNGSGKRRK